jgi:hypothetical protein
LSARDYSFSETEITSPSGTCKWGEEVRTVRGFQCIGPKFVPPHVQPIAYLTLEAVDLGFQSRAPYDLTLPLQAVLQAYFILNTSGQKKLWAGRRMILRSRCR